MVSKLMRQRWLGMKQRCLNPRAREYHNYGGRGITICDRWLASLENFVADMGHPPPGTSIDRIDNDGPYSPENCRWATKREQRINQRTTNKLTIDGETKVLREWAKQYGIAEQTLFNRIFRMKMDPKEALTLPVDARQSRKAQAANNARWERSA